MSDKKIKVYNVQGEVVKEIDPPEHVFSYPVKKHLMWEAVRSYLDSQRKGTASTKTRGEVRGGGRKPWRQKGLGRARAGSIRSPLWRGGGVTFGPKPRDWSWKLPKKARKNALKSAIVSKFLDDELIIIDKFEMEEPKTKIAYEVLQRLGIDNALFVEVGENRNLFLSLRNIPKVEPMRPEQINTYFVLKHRYLVFTERAFEEKMEALK